MITFLAGKRVVIALALSAVFASWAPLAGQSAAAHAVVLSWTASPDSTAANPGSYNIYRASGACSPTSAFTNIGSTGAVTYTDAAVAPGTSCYQVTFVLDGAESVPSNQVSARVLPAPPGAATVVSSK